MGHLIKPLSPFVDTQNPLTKGLVMDFPLFEKGNTITNDVVGKIQGTLTAASMWQTGQFGPQLNFNGTSQQIAITLRSWQTSLTKLTIMAIVNPTNVSAGFQEIFVTGTAFPNTQYQLYYDHALLAWAFNAAFSTTAGEWTIPTASIPTGVNSTVIVTYDGGSTSNAPTFCVNGAIIANTVATAPVGTLVNSSTNAGIGGISSSDWFNGSVSLVRMWSRIITRGEIQKLTVDPFGIYQKSKGGIYLPR